MTIANAISLSRIPMLFVVIGCLMIPTPGAASLGLLAFLVAILSDWLDGFFARLFNQTTSVGAMLDALIDKIFVLGLFFYFLHTRLLPSWGLIPLIIILCREFLITGLRQCALLQGRVLPAEAQGKLKTVVQFLTLTLLVLVPYAQRELGGGPEALALADFFKFFGRLCFVLAAILTVTSGAHYLRHYAYLMDLSGPIKIPEAKK